MSKTKERSFHGHNTNQGTYGSYHGRRHAPAPKPVEDQSLNIYPIRVHDSSGKDVTPVPLLVQERVKTATLKPPKDGRGSVTDTTVTETSIQDPTGTLKPFNSTFQTHGIGGGPFSRSVFQGSTSQKESTQLDEEMEDLSLDSANYKVSQYTDLIKHAEPETEAFTVTLQETETVFLLDFTGVCIQDGTDEADEVVDRNDQYKALCQNRIGNDLYVEKGMKTFDNPLKSKSVQTDPVPVKNDEAYVSNWDKFDCFSREAEVQIAKDEPAKLERTPTMNNPLQKEKGGLGSTRMISLLESQLSQQSRSSSALAVETADSDQPKTIPSNFNSLDHPILHMESFKQALIVMERAVNLNTYQPKQSIYRSVNPIVFRERDMDIDAGGSAQMIESARKSKLDSVPGTPQLSRLWSFQCGMTRDFAVTCLKSNPRNFDLFAVGYGRLSFSLNSSGLVACFSLKNPEFPEKWYQCPAGVTAVAWSRLCPNLLAIGCTDGEIMIFDVSTNRSEPVVTNFSSSGKHTGAVWELHWVEKEVGGQSGGHKDEVVVSCGADGRVVQWQVRKGFEHVDIMKVNRSGKMQRQRAGGHEKKSEAFVAKHSGGTCLDYSYTDNNIYLVGNDEGFIQKCSSSYNEQYLELYSGHMLSCPVYQVRWSKLAKDVFLSCGADWTVRIWNQGRLQPVITCYSSQNQNPVHDVCWSPSCSTVFAVANAGALEIWDLAQSTLDPVLSNKPIIETTISRVAFVENQPVLLVGDTTGQVTVFELRGISRQTADDEAEAQLLYDVLDKSLATQVDEIFKNKQT